MYEDYEYGNDSGGGKHIENNADDGARFQDRDNFGLDKNVLDFIVDDNPLKQGLYTPLTHIPVFSADTLYEYKPKYVLILAWNFADSIMKMHKRYGEEVGQFILPMPVPEIVTREVV